MSIDELDEEQTREYERIRDADIDWETYFELNGIDDRLDEPLVHYVKHWRAELPLVPEFFDTRAYLDLYPDVRSSQTNPLLHYIVHGSKEGRDPCLSVGTTIAGGMENDPALATLVIASHESSATGAPLLGLNVARAFGEKFNVVHMVTRKSDLHEEFRNHCETFIHGVRGAGSKSVLHRLKLKRDVYAVICNSVETHDTLIASSELGLPTVCLVHEFADYTRPAGKMSRVVLRADQVIVPAAVVKESISSELRGLHGIDEPPANVRVLTQGKLPWLPGNWGDDESEDELRQRLGISGEAGIPVIVAGGTVHIRKGVDLYVSLARQIRRKYSRECRFIWVGSGYEPSNDMAYSFWIKKQVELSGLADSLFFLDYQKNLDKVFSIADVFCLTSRMDPFPNMVIDALDHDIHVACFRDGTGCGDFLLENGADCTVVDHLDVGMMADGIVEYLNRPSRSSSRNSGLVRDKLSFPKYLQALEEVMAAAHAAHE